MHRNQKDELLSNERAVAGARSRQESSASWATTRSRAARASRLGSDAPSAASTGSSQSHRGVAAGLVLKHAAALVLNEAAVAMGASKLQKVSSSTRSGRRVTCSRPQVARELAVRPAFRRVLAGCSRHERALRDRVRGLRRWNGGRWYGTTALCEWAEGLTVTRDAARSVRQWLRACCRWQRVQLLDQLVWVWRL